MALGDVGRSAIPCPLVIADEDMDLAHVFFGKSEMAGQSVSLEDNDAHTAIHFGTVLAEVIRVSVFAEAEVPNRYIYVAVNEPDDLSAFELLSSVWVEFSDVYTRASIIEAIGDNGSEGAAEFVIAAMAEDEREQILYAAVDALERIKPMSAIPALRPWLDPDRSPDSDFSWHVAHAMLMIDPIHADLVAACMEFGLEDAVGDVLRDDDWAAFLVQTQDVSQRFGAVNSYSQPLDSDRDWSAVLVPAQRVGYLRH